MTHSDEFLNIDTPENVAFGYEIVGIGSRFMAALVDTLIIVIIYALVWLAMFFIIGNLFGTESMASNFAFGLFSLLGFIFIWGYYIFFEIYWNGRSPGKQLLGLRVVQQDGAPITITESVIRNLVRLVDFLPFAYGIGVVTMFIDGKSRRLGDLAASTLVVRDQEEVTLDSLAQAASQSARQTNYEPVNAIDFMVVEWPLERLTENDIQLAEEFLRRQQSMDSSTDLAGQILKRLLKRMDIQHPTRSYQQNVQTINAIVNLYRQRSAD